MPNFTKLTFFKYLDSVTHYQVPLT